MSKTFTDQITKLAAKLESYDNKIAEYTEQRNQVAAEMQELVSTTSGAKTTITGYNTRTKGKIGDRIVNLLKSNDGQDTESLASRLKISPSKVGVSLYHLTTKGQVDKRDDKYYLTNTNTPATTEV